MSIRAKTKTLGPDITRFFISALLITWHSLRDRSQFDYLDRAARNVVYKRKQFLMLDDTTCYKIPSSIIPKFHISFSFFLQIAFIYNKLLFHKLFFFQDANEKHHFHNLTQFL